MDLLLVPSLVLSLVAGPLAVAVEPPPTPKGNPTADDEARAKELFENGSELYRGGSYTAAVSAFKRAYALSGDPVLLYNIFQTYDRQGDYDGAIEYAEYYQAFAPTSERASLTKKIEGLRRRKLKAQADADAAAQAEADADAAQDQEPISEKETPPQQDQEPATTPPRDEARLFSPLAIGLTALAVVAGGTGIGLGVASSARRRDAEEFCGGSPLICSAQSDADLDSTRGLAIGANVSFAIAGASAIGAIIVVAVNAKKRKSRGGAAAKVELEPAPSGLRLRF